MKLTAKEAKQLLDHSLVVAKQTFKALEEVPGELVEMLEGDEIYPEVTVYSTSEKSRKDLEKTQELIQGYVAKIKEAIRRLNERINKNLQEQIKEYVKTGNLNLEASVQTTTKLYPGDTVTIYTGQTTYDHSEALSLKALNSKFAKLDNYLANLETLVYTISKECKAQDFVDSIPALTDLEKSAINLVSFVDRISIEDEHGRKIQATEANSKVKQSRTGKILSDRTETTPALKEYLKVKPKYKNAVRKK